MSFLNIFFLTSIATFNHIFSALFSCCYLVTLQRFPSLWNYPVSITKAPEGRRRGYRDTGRPTQRERFSKHLPLACQLQVQTDTCWGFVLIQLSGEGLSLLPHDSVWISSTTHFLSAQKVLSLPCEPTKLLQWSNLNLTQDRPGHRCHTQSPSKAWSNIGKTSSLCFPTILNCRSITLKWLRNHLRGWRARQEAFTEEAYRTRRHGLKEK